MVRTGRSVRFQINYEKVLTDLCWGGKLGGRTVSRPSKSTITKSGLEVWTMEGVVKEEATRFKIYPGIHFLIL